MSRDRAFALGMVAFALVCGSLMVAGDTVGWWLWPLLIVLPVAFGRLRMRGSR
jgi:hypothetical protein